MDNNNNNNTTKKFFEATEKLQHDYTLPKKENSIVTKREKTYIVTRNEGAIPQCNKWFYGASAVAGLVFWYCS